MDEFALTAPGSEGSRFSAFKLMVMHFYQWRWGHSCPWDGSEAHQLSLVLKASPKLELSDFKRWLYNYGMSDDITPGERPRSFLPRIHDYSVGPLDRFRRSPDAEIATAQSQRARRNSAALEQARQNRRIAQGPSRDLPTERIEPRRDRTLGGGFKRLSASSD